MPSPSFRDRFQYSFDNIMTRGTAALLVGLFVLSALLVLTIAAVVVLSGEGPDDAGFLKIAWMGLLRTLDTGTMGGDEGSYLFLTAMLAVTLGGVFTVSMLIGILNNGLEDRLTQLRKGRSRVIEQGHTVILGWSDQIFTIIGELAMANANQRKPRIVVLADRDKVEMEEEIGDRVDDLNRTKVICRSGSTMDVNDLAIASIDTAKSIIILSSGASDSDSQVIKALLAITNNPHRRPEPYHIVAEIRAPQNLEAARLVGRDEAELLLVGELVSRIIAQTCRQSGLPVVYTELLDFGGDEIYFVAEPALTGRTFAEALVAYEDSAVIGIVPQGRPPHLNPPMETRIADGDRLVVVTADDDTARVSGRTDLGIRQDVIQERRPFRPEPERTLILGWNWRAPSLISELDHYVPPGSEVRVVADYERGEQDLARMCHLTRQSLNYTVADTTDRRVLDSLDVGRYDHIILLCYSDSLPAQEADARTLITLLHLRDMASKSGQDFSIVSEMLDIRNRALAEVTQADDFIVSDRLISLLLSQISENKMLNAVFTDLFDPEGCEIYLKPAADYVRPGEPVNFYTVVEAARRRGEVAFGYRLKAHASDASRAYGVAVNPRKSGTITFSDEDRIIVLAED